MEFFFTGADCGLSSSTSDGIKDGRRPVSPLRLNYAGIRLKVNGEGKELGVSTVHIQNQLGVFCFKQCIRTTSFYIRYRVVSGIIRNLQF